MSAFSRDRREEERYRIICLRRRAKMEREVRGLCSRPGATIEQVRTRLHHAQQALQEYDSAEEITQPVLERVLRRIEVLAGEREDAATPREPRADAVPSPKEQAAPPPPEDPGVAKSRQEWRGERGAWSSRLSHNSSAAQSEAWHPSNRRYAALSPSFQQEDAMMPHRARGEVDEWASLVEVDRRRRAEESAAEAAAAARKRAAYAGEIGAMLDAKRVEAVRREEERGADLRRVEAQAAREQEAEARERAARRRGQEARREMFDAQLAERRRVKDEAAAEARREEQRLLAHVEVEQRREAEAERARAQAQQEEMHKVRADVERQIAEKRRAQEEERKRDVAVAKEYAEMMERRERMRLDAEAERLERIGKLERLSNDNAARERQLRAEEDARFLAGLAEREAREEAALRARAAREAEERARYRAYLDHELASKTAARAGARAEERRAGEARAAAEQRAARVEADAAAQRAAAAKAAYRDALTGQMRGDAARRQHGWRMSERERALNRDLLDSYLSPPDAGASAGGRGGAGGAHGRAGGEWATPPRGGGGSSAWLSPDGAVGAKSGGPSRGSGAVPPAGGSRGTPSPMAAAAHRALFS